MLQASLLTRKRLPSSWIRVRYESCPTCVLGVTFVLFECCRSGSVLSQISRQLCLCQLSAHRPFIIHRFLSNEALLLATVTDLLNLSGMRSSCCKSFRGCQGLHGEFCFLERGPPLSPQPVGCPLCRDNLLTPRRDPRLRIQMLKYRKCSAVLATSGFKLTAASSSLPPGFQCHQQR